MNRLILLLVLIKFVSAAVYQYPVKVGERLELTIPQKGIRTWERIGATGKQTIRYCTPKEKLPECGQWRDEKNMTTPGARVTKDGRLIIEKVKLADAGSYTSPDEKPPMTFHPDGSISAVGTSMIQVTVLE